MKVGWVVFLLAVACCVVVNVRQEPARAGQGVAPVGRLVTIYPATAIAANDAGTGQTAITNLDSYHIANIYEIVSAKSLAGGGTVNLYLQSSADNGTTWNDIVSYTQITTGAVANGTYSAFLNSTQGANITPTLVTLGTLSAGTTVQRDWSDQMRLYTKAASFTGGDTVTVAIKAYFKP